MRDNVEQKLPDNVIESLIIKGILQDKKFLTLLLKPFDAEYFDNPVYKDAFKFVKNYYQEHLTIPDSFVIKNIIPDYDVIESIDFSIETSFDYLVKETNRYMKEKAVKKAIMDAVEIVDKNQDYTEIRNTITNALAKDILIDIGLDYWDTITDRIKKIYLMNEKRIPLGYPILDEFLNGGLLPYTLSLFLSRIHGFKTTLLINMMQRLSFYGKNVIFFSMEMSQDEIAKRMDSISTLSDVNKMYTSKDSIMRIAKKLNHEKIDKGKVIIKEFPTGQATTSDLRTVLREYQYRGVEFDVIMCDYVTIMKPEKAGKGELYKDGKSISEELRALSGEFNAPVVSVTQLNRSGIEIDFREVDLVHIGESLGISATCDFLAIMGRNNEDLIYESELHYKIVKNRMGGRVNEVGKFYIDKKCLKMYDESELDVWLMDEKATGDTRVVKNSY